MLTDLTVRNFRGFKELALSRTRLVNVVVGRSGSGKTALLEAVRLALAGTPAIAYGLATARGIVTPLQVVPTREQFQALWKNLFFNFQTEIPIEFEAKDSLFRRASVKIRFDDARLVTTNLPGVANAPVVLGTFAPLAFERVNFNGESSIIDITVQPQFNQVYIQPGNELGVSCEFFASSFVSSQMPVPAWFSHLKITNQLEGFTRILREEFPEILEISNESPSNYPTMYAKVAHKSEMMPVSLVSSGLMKWLSLLLAVKTFSHGVVIIDEVENGIFYKMFPSLWKSLIDYARANDTQLFVSTHSLECLRGVSPIMDRSDDLSLIQVLEEDGQSSVVVSSGKKAAAALDFGVELRR